MKSLRNYFALLCALVCCQSALAEEVVIDGLNYSLSDFEMTAEVIPTAGSGTYSSTYSGDIVVPASVTYNGSAYRVVSIGSQAFYKCDITSITLPEGIESLSDNCFYGCSKLTSISIPKSVTSIYQATFSGCTCFNGCASLTSIKVDEDNPVYDSRGNCNAIIETATNTMIAGCQQTRIPNSVTALGHNCFFGCSGLTDITIPEGVTSIGSLCFYNCTSLTSLTIPGSVTTLGDYCFDGCSALTSLTIPEGVTTVGAGCFVRCSSLASIAISRTVTSFGSSCFSSCNSLAEVKVDERNPVYDSRENCNAVIKTATNTLIAGCKQTVIPSSVTTLGDYCFSACQSLTSITLPEGVTSLGNSCFEECWGLASVTLPESLASLGWRCFNFCRSLTSITLPKNMTSLGDYCFNQCEALTHVVSLAETPPTADDEVFEFCDKLKSLYVRSGALAAYRSSVPWSLIKNIYALVDSASVDNSISLPNGQTKKIGYTVYPVGETNCQFQWASSDESVATVSPEGEVTAKGIGQATITVAITSIGTLPITATCLVQVTAATGIDDITTTDNAATYYSLDGTKLSGKPQQGGIYIREQGAQRQKVVIRR